MTLSEKPHRPIRSFVRREGRLTIAQEKALAKFSGTDASKNFANASSAILEIGFGMGHSLLEQAKKNPEKIFIGIEVHRPGVGALLAAMERDNVTNIHVIAEDAVQTLEKIPNNSLAGIQIFFPDPWPKKRHHKRRLVQAPFLIKLAQKLQPGGYLHCATDWQNYAEQMLNEINQTNVFANQSPDNTYAERPESRPITKFEKRGLKLGHSIYDLFFLKKGSVT